jgi:hypothetical protein
MVICPKCGKQIRYINASKVIDRDKIYIVDPQPKEIISEGGWVLTGYSLHTCIGGQNGNENDSQSQASQKLR